MKWVQCPLSDINMTKKQKVSPEELQEMAVRHRGVRWCVTVNAVNGNEAGVLETWRHLEKIHGESRGTQLEFKINKKKAPKVVKYAIMRLERGSREGSLHIQGYIEFAKRLRLTGLKKIHPTAYWVPAIADAKTNKTYVMKDVEKDIQVTTASRYLEWGSLETRVKQGTRTDYRNLWESVKKGDDDLTLVEKYPTLWSINRSSISHLRMLVKHKECQKNPFEKRLVLWFHGPPGTGKSRAARQYAIDRNLRWFVNGDPNLKWWCGYGGEEVVILDDVRYHTFENQKKKLILETFSRMLRLLDGYYMQVETKGSSTTWCPKVIIITAPQDVDTTFQEWQCGDGHLNMGENKAVEDIGQIKRRITGQLGFFTQIEATLDPVEFLTTEDIIEYEKENGLATVTECASFPLPPDDDDEEEETY